MTRRLKSIVAKLHHLGIPLPAGVGRRAENFYKYLKAQELARNLFDSKTLKYDNAGYWYLDPMPSAKELDHYYATAYWATRDDRKVMLKDRDIAHINQLLLTHKDVLLSTKEKTVVNFGAGHGGASFLFHAMGFRVINVDPYPGEVEFFEYRKSLSDITELVDVFYASHSLEHVTDIDSIMSEVFRMVKRGGIVFVEVPNAEHAGYSYVDAFGCRSPLIQPPHTVYFTQRFFSGLQLENSLNETYIYGRNRWGTLDQSGRGEVIRFIGHQSLVKLQDGEVANTKTDKPPNQNAE